MDRSGAEGAQKVFRVQAGQTGRGPQHEQGLPKKIVGSQ